MRRTSYTSDTGETGWFDLDRATLIAADRTIWDGNNRISRATGSQWVREDLHLTAGGVWLIHRENRDARSGPVGLSWHPLTPEAAEDWLRRQDLHEKADEYFSSPQEHVPGGVRTWKLDGVHAGDEPIVTLSLPLPIARQLASAVLAHIPTGVGLDVLNVVEVINAQIDAQVGSGA